MITPEFWYRSTPPERPWDLILPPLARFYGALRKAHVYLTHPTLSPLPTICVGGITAGGAGKTPVVHALLDLFSQPQSFILTRGYGGNLPGPMEIYASRHPAHEAGDEALLHARHARTVVARNRLAGARLITELGGKMIIMDDGLQNRSLAAHANLVVIDGAVGLGNGQLLPAGPLREAPEDVWPRLAAVIIIGEDRTHLAPRLSVHTPVYTAQPRYDMRRINMRARYIAFAGIGRPQKFFDTLQELNVKVVGTAPFPDHHVYDTHNLTVLADWARRERAVLITTEKDLIKLPPEWARHRAVHILPQELVFDDPLGLRDHLRQYLPTSSSKES